MKKAPSPIPLRHLFFGAFLALSSTGFASEGAFDATFGNGGRELVAVSINGHQDSAGRMIVRPDGRILLGGSCVYADPADPQYTPDTFCLTQILAGGAYDGNFGPGGVGYLEFDRFGAWPLNTSFSSMIALQDGRIVVLGVSLTENVVDPTMLVGVLLADGSGLDTTVGGGKGYVQLQFGGKKSSGVSLIQQPDGKILLAGSATGPNGNDDFAVGRLLSDFSGFDPAFGSGGYATVAFDLGGPGGDDSDAVQTVALQSNGKIVLFGNAVTSPAGQATQPRQIALTRLNANGSRDLSFGTSGDGRVHYLAGEAAVLGFDAKIDAADRIVLCGAGAASLTATNTQWIIDRLSRDGGRDAAFAAGNPVIFSAPPGNGGYPTRLALTNDGIFAVGGSPRSTTASTPGYFAVTRLNLDGSFDAKFGSAGHMFGSYTATGDTDASGADIGVGKAGLMVFGTQFQANGSGNNLRFGVARIQYDHIFYDTFETTSFF